MWEQLQDKLILAKVSKIMEQVIFVVKSTGIMPDMCLSCTERLLPYHAYIHFANYANNMLPISCIFMVLQAVKSRGNS